MAECSDLSSRDEEDIHQEKKKFVEWIPQGVYTDNAVTIEASARATILYHGEREIHEARNSPIDSPPFPGLMHCIPMFIRSLISAIFPHCCLLILQDYVGGGGGLDRCWSGPAEQQTIAEAHLP